MNEQDYTLKKLIAKWRGRAAAGHPYASRAEASSISELLDELEATLQISDTARADVSGNAIDRED